MQQGSYERECKRGCQRTSLSIRAELISGNENYCAVIENISTYGLGVKIIHINSRNILEPGSELVIRFCTPCQKIMRLQCVKKWSYKMAPASIIEYVGMEITGAINRYYDFDYSQG